MRGIPRRPAPRIAFTERLARLNRRNPRRFAECDPRRREFFFAPQILSLPLAYRRGLIAHEIGHALMGSKPHAEWMADAAAFDDLDLVIEYDLRWPGKGLQRARSIRRR